MSKSKLDQILDDLRSTASDRGGAKQQIKDLIKELIQKGVPDYSKMEMQNDDLVRGYKQAIAEIHKQVEAL